MLKTAKKQRKKGLWGSRSPSGGKKKLWTGDRGVKKREFARGVGTDITDTRGERPRGGYERVLQ